MKLYIFEYIKSVNGKENRYRLNLQIRELRPKEKIKN